MKHLIKILFSFSLFFSICVFSAFPEEHVLFIESENTNTNQALRKALNISSLRILGSKNEFDQNKKLISSLNPDSFVKSYEFQNQDKIKIVVNARLLRKKFLDSNLSISLEERQSITAWILCKTDLSSKRDYDLIIKKCNKAKQFLKKASLERDINLIYPILDSNDLSSLDIEYKDEPNENSFINKRYLSDESIYCEITLNHDNCYQTESAKNTKIDFSKIYTLENIFNKTADAVQQSEKVYINRSSFKPISIFISNINSIEDYDYVFQELEKIIFFNNLALDSLKKNDVVFSSDLLGKISEIENIFKKKKNFFITSINKKKIFLEYIPKENVENNS